MENKYTGTIKFRGRYVYYSSMWLDDCTFALMLSDGEFVDDNGDEYWISFEYNTKSDNWIIEIIWTDDHCRVGFRGSEKYITNEEIQEIKKIVSELATL
jgi:hypothetical protein